MFPKHALTAFKVVALESLFPHSGQISFLWVLQHLTRESNLSILREQLLLLLRSFFLNKPLNLIVMAHDFETLVAQCHRVLH